MRIHRIKRNILFLLIIWAAWPLRISGAKESAHAQATLISNHTAIKPGESFQIGVHFFIEKDWHIYGQTPGDSGLPTKISWTVPPELKISALTWPPVKTFSEPGGLTVYGYTDEVTLTVTATLDQTWPVNKPLVIAARADWLVCKTLCLPGKADLALTIPVGKSAVANPDTAILFERAARTGEPASKISFGVALLFAFFGGLLLNLMPCVLPVLSIKILRLIKQQEHNRAYLTRENLILTAGILTSFLLLGAVVVSLKAAGHQLGWGFQFQEPRFVIAMMVVVFAFALSLFGLFDVTITLPPTLNRLTISSDWTRSFWDGFLTTTLATPCTAPFLGPALGFAFTQSAAIILVFLFTIGLGLSFPYILIAIHPPVIHILPKPGAWMETLKKFFGVPLFATAVWLLWVLYREMGAPSVLAAGVLLVIVGIALWALGRWGTPIQPHKISWTTRGVAIVAVFVTYAVAVEPVLRRGPALENVKEVLISPAWQSYSHERLEQALSEKKTVLVDFTAAWCLTCQVNKRVLKMKSVDEAIKRNSVVALQADWTNRDPDITALLSELGRSGVPAYAIFKNGDRSHPILLSEILTENAVLKALAE